MHQWTGPRLQVHVAPRVDVKDEASAEALASAIENTPRKLFGGGTSISGAIDYSRLILARSPLRATRRTIDVSGDGANNIGRPARIARDQAVRDGITINGRPILSVEPDLDTDYFENVIGGPGAVMVPADSHESFAEAYPEEADHRDPRQMTLAALTTRQPWAQAVRKGRFHTAWAKSCR